MTDFQKGQTVTVIEGGDYPISIDSWSSRRIIAGAKGTVTQVYRKVLRVQFEGVDYILTIPREKIEAPNGETYTPPVKPVTRKLGEVPEGMIAPDDPRIAWIFEDAAKLANKLSFCGEYDQLAAKLGLPGRLRNISVSTKIDGLHVTAQVQARSEKEAEKILQDKLRLAFTK